jgi:hypothetical protein
MVGVDAAGNIINQVQSLESLTRVMDISSKRRSILSRDQTINKVSNNIAPYNVPTRYRENPGVGFRTISKNSSKLNTNSDVMENDNFIREYVIKSDDGDLKSTQ